MTKLRKIFISHCWDYEDDYDTIKTWLDNTKYYSFQDYSISTEKKLEGLNDSELANAISERIRQCSLFIVPTAVYVTYSNWVKFEIDTALQYKKIILGVSPWAQKHYSKLVTTNADKIVGWNSNSVVQAVKLLTSNNS